MAQCTSLDTSQDIQHIMHRHEQEDDEDDDDEKDDDDDDDVVTVHANACVSPDLLHLKHPETPQEPQTLKDPSQTPPDPQTTRDLPGCASIYCTPEPTQVTLSSPM